LVLATALQLGSRPSCVVVCTIFGLKRTCCACCARVGERDCDGVVLDFHLGRDAHHAPDHFIEVDLVAGRECRSNVVMYRNDIAPSQRGALAAQPLGPKSAIARRKVNMIAAVVIVRTDSPRASFLEVLQRRKMGSRHGPPFLPNYAR
jgi:hypothetical protein